MGSGVPLLELTGISKAFGGVVALRDVDFAIQSGEIHGLFGENGAGKSTLMKIIAGVYTHYQGVMRLDGAPVRFHSARDALVAGVGMVHQELSIVPDLTVAENVFLGSQPTTRLGIVRKRGGAKRPALHLLEWNLGLIKLSVKICSILRPINMNMRTYLRITNKKLKFNFHTVVILPIACLLTFSGCSSLEGTVDNHRGTINLLKSIEQEHKKPENPPVRPGQPYNRHNAADRDVVAVSPSSTYRVLKIAGDRSDSRHAEA